MGQTIMISRLGVPGLFGMTLGLGLAILSRSHTAAEAFDPDTIRCFAAPAVAMSVSGTAQTAPDVQHLRHASEPLTEAAILSTRACTAGACGSEQHSALRDAVSRYLDARRAITSELYRRHRNDGLAIADQLFDTAHTKALSQALADLYAQRRLDPAQFGGNRDALALLISKPAEAFRPCTAPAASRNVFWYVY